MYLLGEENFSRALQKYFSKYAFANAVLDDLLAHLEEFFKEKSIGVSLEQWK